MKKLGVSKLDIFLILFIVISLLFTLYFPQRALKQYAYIVYIIDALILLFLVKFKKK